MGVIHWCHITGSVHARLTLVQGASLIKAWWVTQWHTCYWTLQSYCNNYPLATVPCVAVWEYPSISGWWWGGLWSVNYDLVQCYYNEHNCHVSWALSESSNWTLSTSLDEQPAVMSRKAGISSNFYYSTKNNVPYQTVDGTVQWLVMLLASLLWCTDSGDGVLRDFTYCFIPLSATSLRATCGCGQEYSDTPLYTCNKLKMQV